MNKVQLIGNIGNDIEVKNLSDDKKVVNFSLATNEKWGEGDNEKTETDWHNIVAWGKVALAVGNYTKGDFVEVVGNLKYDTWEDETGVKRTKAYVRCYKIAKIEKAA